MIMGTVTYMSPEQLCGQKVDARADIFSLGVVLYEMIAGTSPFAGGTQAERIAAILEREPAPLSDRRPDVPHELERIVRKTLRKNLNARYQLVDDLLADLKDLKQELEFQARLRRSAQHDAHDQMADDRRPEAGSTHDAVEHGQALAKRQQDRYSTAIVYADDYATFAIQQSILRRMRRQRQYRYSFDRTQRRRGRSIGLTARPSGIN